ncbi:MAG: hypothetical protein ABSH53_16995 [Holophaga sp.]|jgi:hypothetical protein
MSRSLPHPPRPGQEGGVTILIALMMLVLLTIAAVGMSRNSFRNIVTSGFSRQGAEARNTADSGLEWAVFWMSQQNAPAATGNAQQLNSTQNLLLANIALSGQSTDIITQGAYQPGGALQAGMTLPTPAGTTAGYTLGMTRMGKMPLTNFSQAGGGTGGGLYNPGSGVQGQASPAPDIWAVRSDAQVQQGGVTFTHGVEAWITTPTIQQ